LSAFVELKMNRSALALAMTMSLAFGCKAIKKKDMMIGKPSIGTEKQKVWHRPVEVTYEFAPICEGESSTNRLFGLFRVAGDPAAGGPSLNLFGGGGGGLDGNGTWAAARAIDSGAADGLYLTRVETEKNIVFPMWSKRTYVKGRCLKLKELGTINQERDRLNRFGYEPKR
jgi:hypothetical protein